MLLSTKVHESVKFGLSHLGLPLNIATGDPGMGRHGREGQLLSLRCAEDGAEQEVV